MGKDGHMGVVSNTKMQVVKIYDGNTKLNKNESDTPYQNISKPVEKDSSTIYPAYTRSNYEALSPERRSQTLISKFSSPTATNDKVVPK